MAGQNVLSIFHQPATSVRIAQEFRNTLTQLVRVADFDRRLVCNERAREREKVLHVRAEDDRFACEDRFRRILTSMRGETFSHEHDSRDGIPVSKLASGVQEQTVRCFRRVSSVCLAAQRDP